MGMLLFSGSAGRWSVGLSLVFLCFCGVVLISEFSKLGAELKTPDSNRQALADQFPGLLVA